jgi:Domain of unknown function (DUF2431)
MKILKVFLAGFLVSTSWGMESGEDVKELEKGIKGITLSKNTTTDKIKSVPEKRYKKKLIIGEADFSFTTALIKKQLEKGLDGFQSCLVATEYNSETELEKTYKETFPENKKFLDEHQVKLCFGFDGTNIKDSIENDEKLKEFFTNPNDKSKTRVKRIHFNFPHTTGVDGKAVKTGKPEDVQKLVGSFFESANQVQLPKDRVYMALPKKDPEKEKAEPFLVYLYNVFKLAKNSGYKVYKKRLFNDESDAKKNRYKGYKHVKNVNAKSGGDGGAGIKGREYIFEKIDTTKENIDSFYNKCTYEDKNKNFKEYYYPKNQNGEAEDPKTDNDSSSYEEDEENEKEQKEPLEQDNQTQEEEKKSDE